MLNMTIDRWMERILLHWDLCYFFFEITFETFLWNIRLFYAIFFKWFFFSSIYNKTCATNTHTHKKSMLWYFAAPWTRNSFDFPLIFFSLQKCFFFLAYTTFADISLAPNGFRRLVLQGYRFGERGSSSGVQFWQCTANVRDFDTGKSRRCPARIRTKILGLKCDVQC